MAKVRICDFCGESPVEKNLPLDHEPKKWIKVEYEEFGHNKRIDICPECRKNVRLFDALVKEEVLESNRKNHD